MWRVTHPSPPGSKLADLRLLVRLVRYHDKLYWRSPVATFFTMALPPLLLLMMVAALGEGPEVMLGMPLAQFYAPTLAAYGAVSVCYLYLAVATAVQKQEGGLKRLRGTPVPTWVFFSARIISTAWLSCLVVALLLGLGLLIYGIDVIPARLPAVALTLLVGILVFSTLGLALAAIAGSGDAAQALGNVTLLPLGFISDVFMLPIGNAPRWLTNLADFFPLKHFAVAFARGFDPRYTGNGFQWSGGPHDYAILPHLAVLLAWGAVGLAIAMRFFRWEPRADQRASTRAGSKAW